MRLTGKLVDAAREAERWILDVIGEGNSIEIPQEDIEEFYEAYYHVVVIESNDEVVERDQILGIRNMGGALYVKLLIEKEWLNVYENSEVIYEIMLFMDDVNDFYKRKEGDHDEL